MATSKMEIPCFQKRFINYDKFVSDACLYRDVVRASIRYMHKKSPGLLTPKQIEVAYPKRDAFGTLSSKTVQQDLEELLQTVEQLLLWTPCIPEDFNIYSVLGEEQDEQYGEYKTFFPKPRCIKTKHVTIITPKSRFPGARRAKVENCIPAMIFTWAQHYRVSGLSYPKQSSNEKIQAQIENVVPNMMEMSDDEQESYWSTATDFLQICKEQVVSVIVKAMKQYIHAMDGYIPIITSLVASVLSALTSITVLCSSVTTRWVKGLLITNLIASLTSFCTSIGGMLAKTQHKFDTDKAIAEIATLADEMSNQVIKEAIDVVTPNAIDTASLVKLGISSMVILLLAGLGFSGAMSARDISTHLSCVRGMKDLTSTISDSSSFVMENLLGIASDKDHPACKVLEDLTEHGAELIAKTPSYYIQNPDKYKKLLDFLPSVVKATSQSIPKDMSYRYSSTKSILVTQYKALLELDKSIKAILNTKQRQGTIGYVLSGEPGHGKSEFAKYVAKEVADVLTYPHDIYCLNKRNEGFYEAYGGQRFGVFNEWMARREEDPILPDINLIFSTDPMNFEGAALDVKNQPCRLALGCLTTNVHDPELTRVLNAQAAQAVWDRLIHFEVHDPKCKGRHEANNHRKPDFSHLSFNLIKHRGKVLTRYPITKDQLISMLAGRVALAEKAHLLDVQSNSPDAVKAELQVRVDLLSDLVQDFPPYESLLNLKAIKKGVTPNALGREFFIIRMQGLPGSGKSSACDAISMQLKTIFNLDVQISNTVSEFKPIPEKPMIYVFDDWVCEEVDQFYLENMNRTHSRSLFIITSNQVFKQYTNYMSPSWVMSKVLYKAISIWPILTWDSQPYNYHSGMLRRLGLQGGVRLKSGEMFTTPEHFQKTYTFHENFIIKDAYGQITNRQQIVEAMFRNYIMFMDRPVDFSIVKSKPPVTAPSQVVVTADNQYELIKCLRSTAAIIRAYQGVHESVRLSVDYMDLSNDGGAQTMVTSWRIYEPETDDPKVMESVFSRMCATFGRLYPNKSFRVECTEDNTVYYYHKGIGYIYNPQLVESVIDIKFTDKVAMIQRPNGHIIQIDVAEFVGAKYFSEFKGRMLDLNLPETTELFRLVDLASDTDGFVGRYKVAVHKEMHRLKRHHNPALLLLRTNLETNPIYWFLCALLGLLAVGGTIYGIIKLCNYMLSRTAEPNSNNDPSDGSDTRYKPRTSLKRIGRRAKANHEDDSEGREFIPKKILRRVKPNSECYYEKYESAEDHDVIANMLTAKERSVQPPTMLESFAKRINKSYVRVYDNQMRTCYGLVLKTRYVLTVAHMFELDQDTATVMSGGKSYKAVVRKIIRSQDLAFLEVTDQSFPHHPDIRRALVCDEEVGTTKHGFFLRPGVSQIMSGILSYYHTTSYPVTSSKVKQYNLSDKFLIFTSIGLQKLSAFIQNGDCGFPLVVINKQNEVKIIGLHNAYNDTERSYFSNITQEMMDEFFIDVQPNAAEYDDSLEIVQIPDVDFVGLMPIQFADAFDKMEEEYSFTAENDKLEILGYVRQLNYRSNPRGKHKHIGVEDLETPKLKIPGAYTMKYVTNTDDLVKDNNGNPHPLFTQCIKYDKRKQTTFDQDIFDRAVELVRQDCKNRYDGCTILRLHQVVNGLDNAPLKALDLDTSAGPLLKLIYKIHDKKPLFKQAENSPDTLLLDLDSPAGRHVNAHWRTYMHSLLEDAVPPFILSKDCAKVENIDIDKAQKGKVRLFNEVDISVNMTLKAFFGSFLSKVIQEHNTAPIRIGQDPYKTSTSIARQFREIDGTMVSTDFSAFDKQLPLELIYAFCDIVASCVKIPGKSRYEIHQIYRALAGSLTYVAHTCNGVIYLVDRGNESGTYVTTLLNSVSVQILTYYTVLRKWYQIHRFYPTLSEIQAETRLAVLGDDRSFKSSKAVPITEEDFVEDSLLFCLKCQPAKTDSGLDFCSRAILWDDNDNVAYPALKMASITNLIHWYAALTEEQILNNLDQAMFESALHADPTVFSMILGDAIKICKAYSIDVGRLNHHSRANIRERFVAAVRHDDSYNMISLHVDEDTDNPRVHRELNDSEKQRLKLDFFTDFEAILQGINLPVLISHLTTRERRECIKAILTLKDAMADPSIDPVSALNEFCQKMKLSVTPEMSYDNMGSQHEPHFVCTLEFATHRVQGFARTKKQAKQNAYSQLYELIVPKDVVANAQQVEQQAQNVADLFTDSNPLYMQFTEECIKQQLELARKIKQLTSAPIIVLAKNVPQLIPLVLDNIRTEVDLSGNVYVLSKTAQKFPYEQMRLIYFQQPDTIEAGEVIRVEDVDTIPNSAPPADAAQNPGISTIPHLANPVPASYAPAMQPNPPPTMGALEMIVDQETYNTAGPPNMLSTGAISFDLKDLVYSQFMDNDAMVAFTDDAPDGQIIAQIPYDPLSSFMNPYIRQYVSLHERYAGDILIRVTLVGNQTFSGLVGICWMPNKVNGTSIKISEAMKYSYAATTVNEMWNKVYRLKDARQSQFWRKVSERDDVDSRPHLVYFVMMNAQSPLRTGINVRMRFASQLDSSFQVANPTLPNGESGGDVGAFGFQLGIDRMIGQAIIPTLLRPYGNALGIPFRCVIDGNTWLRVENDIRHDHQVTALNEQTATSVQTITVNAPGAVESITKLQAMMNGPCHNYVWLYINEPYDELNPNVERTSRHAVFFDFTKMDNSLNNRDFNRKAAPNDFEFNPINILWNAAQILGKRASQTDGVYKDDFFGQLNEIINDGANSSNFRASSMVRYLVPSQRNLSLRTHESATPIVRTGDKLQMAHYMTNRGPIFATYLQLPDIKTDPELAYNILSNPSRDWFTTINQVSTIEYLLDEVEAMPAGWRHVALTCDVPNVMSAASRLSWMQNHSSLAALIEHLNLGIPSTHCLQIGVADIESGQIITYIRYLMDRRTAIINVGDSDIYYATSARHLDRMYIQSISIIPRTNEFPRTDVATHFLENQVHPDVMAKGRRKHYVPDDADKDVTPNMHHVDKTGYIMDSVLTPIRKLADWLKTKVYHPDDHDRDVHPNMDIIGGIIGGVGQGISKGQDRKHEKEMQENEQKWKSGENAADRDWRTGERQENQGWQSGENAADRDWRTGESSANRDWQSGENQANRDWQAEQGSAQRGWQSDENALLAGRQMERDYGQSMNRMNEQANWMQLLGFMTPGAAYGGNKAGQQPKSSGSGGGSTNAGTQVDGTTFPANQNTMAPNTANMPSKSSGTQTDSNYINDPNTTTKEASGDPYNGFGATKDASTQFNNDLSLGEMEAKMSQKQGGYQVQGSLKEEGPAHPFAQKNSQSSMTTPNQPKQQDNGKTYPTRIIGRSAAAQSKQTPAANMGKRISQHFQPGAIKPAGPSTGISVR